MAREPPSYWSGDNPLPVVIAFDPPKALPGTRITITAANFYSGRVEEWRFGGVPALYYGPSDRGSHNDNEIGVVLPKGAHSGKITITTDYGTAESATDFEVLAYTGLSVTLASSPLIAGQTRQLAAAASASDGTTADVTAGVTWTSANPAVATVSEKGLLYSTAPGTARITASLEGFTAIAIVKVLPARPRTSS